MTKSNLLDPDGTALVERFTALLLAAAALTHEEFEHIAEVALGQPDDRAIREAFKFAAKRKAFSQGVSRVVDKVARKHHYWSTVCLELQLVQRSGKGPYRATAIHLAYLRERNPELWSALACAGAPDCVLSATGIVSHHNAENVASMSMSEPLVMSAVDAVDECLKNDLE